MNTDFQAEHGCETAGRTSHNDWPLTEWRPFRPRDPATFPGPLGRAKVSQPFRLITHLHYATRTYADLASWPGTARKIFAFF